MQDIQQITNDALQSQEIILPDGTSFQLTLYFMPMQYCWLIRSLVYGDFTLNGLRISVSPNMLHQWRNQIPFGIACSCVSDREPTQQQDFITGAAKLYLLSQDEVNQYTEVLAGG